MFASLAFVFLFGLMGAAVFEKMKLPRISGMLLVGILIGPYALGLLDPTILSISGDLRKLALMLILLRAGLSLDLGDLKRVGRPAVLMAFVPATFEVLAVVLFAPLGQSAWTQRQTDCCKNKLVFPHGIGYNKQKEGRGGERG